MGSWQVSDIQDWNVLPGSPLYPPAVQFLTKTITTTTKVLMFFDLGRGRRGHGEWHMAHQETMGIAWSFQIKTTSLSAPT